MFLDSLRQMIFGDYDFNKIFEPVVKDMSQACINSALTAVFNVIVDEVQLTPVHRRFITDSVRVWASDAKIVFCHFAEMENNLKNRMTDPKGIPEAQWAGVIASMREAFVPISSEEDHDYIYLPPKFTIQ